ncbi:RNA-binding protein [Asaia siamensis]
MPSPPRKGRLPTSEFHETGAQDILSSDHLDPIELDDEKGPQRRCIVTRESGNPDVMLRFVISPDGLVVPDLAAKLPGRGIWLSAKRDVLETARTRHVFSRAARQPVKVPEDIAQVLVSGIEARLVQGLGLARRAGQALCGFVKCREWIAGGKAGLVIQGSGGSPDELRRLISGNNKLPMLTLPAQMLATAFGREHAVYVVIAPGALAQRLMAEHERFLGLTDGLVPEPLTERLAREQAGI